jgi:hypothetical protein
MPTSDTGRGSKKASLSLISSRTGLPLLSMNWMSSPSMLCPTRNPAVENSVAIPGFTSAL